MKHCDLLITDGASDSRIESEICVVMPTIDLNRALETSKILKKRAEMDFAMVLAHDTNRRGFVETLNSSIPFLTTKFVAYVAEDSFPGRGWLRIAYEALTSSGKGLLGFNDGKWAGRIASFGLVRVEWVLPIYDDTIFFPGYKNRGADTELTLIAYRENQYVYEPGSVLVEYDPEKDFRPIIDDSDFTLLKNRIDGGSIHKLCRSSNDTTIQTYNELVTIEGWEATVTLLNEHQVKKAYKPIYFELNATYSRDGEAVFMQNNPSPFFASLLEAHEDFILIENAGMSIGIRDKEISGGRRINFENAEFAPLHLLQWLDDLEGELARLKISHRDINPLNIVFDSRSNQFKLLDFTWAVSNSEPTHQLSQPPTLNPYAETDAAAIMRMRYEIITYLASQIASSEKSPGSSTSKGWLYHPLPFPEFDFPVHKNLAPGEFAEINKDIEQNCFDSESILDIGSSVGYFSFSFANLNKKVIGIEFDSKAYELAESIRLFKKINNVRFLNQRFDRFLFDLIDVSYDIVLMLNVHMWIYKQEGANETKQLMCKLSRLCKHLYFQTAGSESGGLYKVMELQNIESIQVYLEDCGFTNVRLIRSTTLHGGLRHMFYSRGRYV